MMRFAGMRAVVRLNNPAGSRVQRLEIGGADTEPARRYTVAAAGEQSAPDHAARTMTGVRAIDSVRAYLSTHRPVDTPLTHRAITAV